MLFAGIRFAAAGLIVLSLARINGRSFKTGKTSDWWFLLAFALMNTTPHRSLHPSLSAKEQSTKGCSFCVS